MKFQATIYRTSASCGISGNPQRTIAAAFESARTKAGALFLTGISATNGECWGYDARNFVAAAELACRGNLAHRPVTMTELRDNRSDVTVELKRV